MWWYDSDFMSDETIGEVERMITSLAPVFLDLSGWLKGIKIYNHPYPFLQFYYFIFF